MLIRRWITLGGITLIVLIVAADSYEAWQDYRALIRDNDDAQLALGRVLAEQTAGMVREADVAMSAYTDWAASTENHADDSGIAKARLLADFSRLPFVHSATATDAAGRVMATTQDGGAARSSFGNRTAFTTQRDAAEDQLYIGSPYVASRDGSVNFALSRRIEDAHGGFAGIVVASIAFDYLTGFYSGVGITSDTTIRVAREDGVVLAQYPLSDAVIAGDRSVQQGFSGLGASSEQVRREVAADGESRVVALRRVQGYPLVVEVSRSMRSVLVPWVQRELASAARTLALVLLATVLLVQLRSSLNRRERLDAERHRLEKELEIAQRQEALGFLAASVVHDFNNVLSAVIGYAELARNSLGTDSPARVNLDRLLAATERARMMVRRLLTFNPHRSVGYEAVQLQPVVTEVLQQMQATLPASITVRTSGFELQPMMRGDATELHQVVMNLCTNAVQAMPGGGTLELRVELLSIDGERVLNVGALSPGRWVCLSVIDSGVGLPPDKLSSIFEPFYTTREPGQGSGIGLAVVRNVVTRMGGAIEVASRECAGTRMSVYWPLLAVTASPTSQSETRGGGRGEAVMLVDDEADLVGLAEEQLAALGYEPVGFTDPNAALAAFTRSPERFEAIITDERMPGMRGAEFARRIHAVRASIPVIIVTGHREADLDQRAREAGVAEILDKPLPAQELRAALERQLHRRAAAAETPSPRARC